MVSSADGARAAGPFPAAWAFLGLLLLGVAAVIALPQIGDDLPHFGRDDQARYAITCLGVLALTGGYLYLVAWTRGVVDRAWMLPTFVYVAGLAIVKFILSPTAFQKSSDASLAGFMTAGMVVMPLYIVALGLMYSLALRKRGEWTLSSRLGFALGWAAIAVTTRLLVSLVLGTASDYLDDLVGPGLVLPTVVAVASLAVMESFDRAGTFARDLLFVGIAVVIAHHVLWVVYMNRLF
ncbi:MAG: hypothetical protein M3271_03910 [Actinomycetota bacterium]|nr:hypothetical protein [Actinomycetota bacterium]